SRSLRSPVCCSARAALPAPTRRSSDLIALCAEAVGAMDQSLKDTVEYIKTRKQFGVAIGSFQSLQHRAADMFVALEQARSMSMLDRKSTRLNSSHVSISYAVFCLNKKM